MMSEPLPKPLIELVKKPSCRAVIEATGQMDHEEWYETSEVCDMAGISKESFRKGKGPLLMFGILDTRNEDGERVRGLPTEDEWPKYPHYTLADSQLRELIASWDQYPLVNLFASKARQQLVEWFVTVADSTKTYTKSAIQDEADMGYQGVANNLDTLHESGLIVVDESGRYPTYGVDTDSEIYENLRELNNAAYDTYMERTTN